ncbi:Male sterility NAD-binding [Penicillium canescens]|uniref:Male sterility NAD-binding n=1 Tax=Penicillium canescens TaxID=5083 RepID=UPI0026E0E64A|nr:Male sterility NAD-binding [Penicillium canescens]KAJ6048207.1 Male sterility NAD-binding [Penicillium canescens]
MRPVGRHNTQPHYRGLDGFSYVADEATLKALFKKVILLALGNLRHALEKGSEELLMPHQRGYPITYNHYFTETL